MRLVIRKIAVSFFILLMGMVVIGQNGNGGIKLKKPKRTCQSFARARLKPLEPKAERITLAGDGDWHTVRYWLVSEQEDAD